MQRSNLVELPPPPPGKTGWPWRVESPQLPETMPDGQRWPRISIVIPSLNQGVFIEEAIRSVLLQGYPDVELIIIDGGSSDNTLGVLEKYYSKLAYWVSEPDRGQSHALNKGFAKSTGTIMAWLCADDMYLPGAFFRAASIFHEAPYMEFVYGDGRFIDENSRTIKDVRSTPVQDRNNFHNNNYVFSTTAFWKKSIWERSGGYIDEKNNWTMDWELFIRMNKEAKLYYRQGLVACLRKHKGAKTHNGVRYQTPERNKEILSVSRKYGGFFCYNNLIYYLLQIAHNARHFEKMPKPIYSAIFALLHLPIRMTSRSKKSIFFNGRRR